MSNPIVFGRKQKPPPPCVCGHYRNQHRRDRQCQGEDELGCTCRRYQRPDQPDVKQKRKSYKRGYGFEVLVAEVCRGERKGRAGQPDVIVGDLVNIECEETKTAHLSKARVEKHRQAERLCRVGALPAYAFRRKLGPGKSSQAWVLMTLENYGKLLEQVSA